VSPLRSDDAAERSEQLTTSPAADGPVLALETATRLGSAAVGRAGRVLAEVTLGVTVRHSEALLPAVRFVLEQARLVPADLTAIVVGGGPGSFTGVRIAGATAKGLVQALGVPLFAYSSLAGLAAGAGRIGRPVCALIEAHGTEVFAACYRFPPGGGLDCLLEPSVLEIDGLAERLSGQAPVWTGSAAHRFAALLSRHGEIAGEPLAVPRAASLLWLAMTARAAGRVADPARWTPDYVRAPGVTRPA
jgi:tRNA threonylcarbamoyladenosine biosynthesis protein TsaB